MSSAIVTGATGILGREIVLELSRHPQQWKTVYALSRSKKDKYPPAVVHSHLDLTSSDEEMADELKDIDAEYVFFAAYLEKETQKELAEVNSKMLSNFLNALEKTGKVNKLKRIILVTGAKQYGVHLGANKNPMVEGDPWLVGDAWPPNFYYWQQGLLKDFCKKNSHISWVVTYPNDVIGFAKGNFMNLASALGMYVAVVKELGQDLVFPGSEVFYTKFDTFTDSKLHARFCEWTALEPKAGNQAFNVVNGDVESWQNLWPKIAKRFGMKVKADQFAGPAPLSSDVELTDKPPLSAVSKEIGLDGKIEPSRLQQRVDLAKWSQETDVKEAWARLADREGLDEDAFKNGTWNFLGFVLARNYDIVQSMSKARALGWHGYYDTWSAFSVVFDELETAQIIPKCVMP